MSSLLTNASAMTALQTLANINKNLATTQERISTGMRVNKASDNAAYWSIATTMRSDNSALSAVQDALGLGAAKVDTAYAGIEQAIEYVKQIKEKLITAQEPSADKAKIQGDIKQLQDQLRGIVGSASFSGENWLQADLSDGAVTKSVVASFVRDSSGDVSVRTIDYTLNTTTVLIDSSGGGQGILDKEYNVSQNAVTLQINLEGVPTEFTVAAYSTDELIAQGNAVFDGDYAKTDEGDFVRVQGVWVAAVQDDGTTGQEIAAEDSSDGWWIVDTSAAPASDVPAGASVLDLDVETGNLDSLLKAVDMALSDMTAAASSLGSISSRIDMQTEFVSKLMDSLDRGIGRLVDADMEKESARLSALQVQQQLGIQALSIANANAQNILALFR